MFEEVPLHRSEPYYKKQQHDVIIILLFLSGYISSNNTFVCFKWQISSNQNRTTSNSLKYTTTSAGTTLLRDASARASFAFKRNIYPPIHTYFKFSWSSGLIRQLLILTHQQWLYSNCTVHYRTDGRSLPQHKVILQKVASLFHTDEDMHLPEDQDLLLMDFAQRGKGATVDQERWIAKMNSAM